MRAEAWRRRSEYDSNHNVLSLRFPGQQYDQETGTHYNYFRDYEPGVGRYVQSDPVGLRGGAGLYSYAEMSPVKSVDQFGLFVIPDNEGSCGYCRSNPRIGDAIRKACADLSRIRSPELRACIKRRCDDPTFEVHCEDCGANRFLKGFAPYVDGVYIPYLKKQVAGYVKQKSYLRYIVLCASSVDFYFNFYEGMGDTVIHEFAHTCGWQHDGGAGGVKDDPSRLPGSKNYGI